jgi:hypothetical protein
MRCLVAILCPTFREAWFGALEAAGQLPGRLLDEQLRSDERRRTNANIGVRPSSFVFRQKFYGSAADVSIE